MAVDPGTLRSGIDRRSYTWTAVAAAIIVFAGFARTYFLKSAFGAPALSGPLHLHGLVMTRWFALFILQTRLVAVGRTNLHRRMGVIGALLATLVLIAGVATAIAAARRGVSPGPPPLVFLTIPLGDMLVFAILVDTGLLLRRRSDFHKWFMLLATLSILTAAIARIPLQFIQTGGLPVFFGLTDVCILACVAFDTVKHRRLHPAFGWGGLLIVASQPLRFLLAGTPAWTDFAGWLVK